MLLNSLLPFLSCCHTHIPADIGAIAGISSSLMVLVFIILLIVAIIWLIFKKTKAATRPQIGTFETYSPRYLLYYCDFNDVHLVECDVLVVCDCALLYRAGQGGSINNGDETYCVISIYSL